VPTVSNARAIQTSGKLSDPVNANAPVAPGARAPAGVDMMVTPALIVRVDLSASSPDATTVWPPIAASSGIVTGVENCPFASAVTVASGTESDSRVITTLARAAKPGEQLAEPATIVWPGTAALALSARLHRLGG